MSISNQLDKASGQLRRLSEKARAAEVNANAAKDKGKAALLQRVDAVQGAAKKTTDNLKASVQDSKDETSKWWGQVQDNWKSHVAKLQEAKKNLKQERAEVRAERAEADAVASVEFAYAALEQAEYQVLNAALTRLDAEEAAT